ncbi:hypothetical protein PG984_004675 [Apiospora sp. TS-2023a]
MRTTTYLARLVAAASLLGCSSGSRCKPGSSSSILSTATTTASATSSYSIDGAVTLLPTISAGISVTLPSDSATAYSSTSSVEISVTLPSDSATASSSSSSSASDPITSTSTSTATSTTTSDTVTPTNSVPVGPKNFYLLAVNSGRASAEGMPLQYNRVNPDGALALIPEDSVAAQYDTAEFHLEPNTGLLMVQSYYVYATTTDNELYLTSASLVDDGTDLVHCASPVLPGQVLVCDDGHGHSQFRLRQISDYILVRLDMPDSPGDPRDRVDLFPVGVR